MTADTGRHWRRIAGSSLGLLLSATSLTAHAQCSERLTALQAAPVSQQSRWRELDASGRQLVRESGSLHEGVPVEFMQLSAPTGSAY